MATKLQELQNKLTAKQNLLQSIYSQSKRSDGDYDFTKAEEFSHLVDGRDKIEAQKACIEALNDYEREASDLFDEVKTIQDMQGREEKLQKQIDERRKVLDRHQHPTEASHNGGQPMQMKSLGTLVKEYWPDPGERRNGPIMFDREFKNWDIGMLGLETKTLMERTAGWAPESTRIPRIVEFAHRPVQVTDLFPIGNTSQALIKYMEETTSNLNAVEKAEGVAAAEAQFELTERSVTVERLPVYLTVTDEQLADVDQVAGFIDARLRFAVNQRLDTQLIAGDGISPNIAGIILSGAQSQATGGDNSVDAVYKAMVKVRVIGRASPSSVVIHPYNFQPIRLMKANGMYVWGAPSEVGPMRLWGVPIVETDAITANTALVGDFTNFSQLWMRQGVEVAIGYVGNTFIEGKQVIRVTLRAALARYRAAAFCTVTGLPQT